MDLSPKSRGSYFSPEFFKFLRDLARNNNREWFQKNKPRYERFVFIPSLRFIKDAKVELKAVSPYLVADPRPFGGRLFRVSRDMSVSTDQSPYQTEVARAFSHQQGGEKSYTVLELHRASGEPLPRGGLWH